MYMGSGTIEEETFPDVLCGRSSRLRKVKAKQNHACVSAGNSPSQFERRYSSLAHLKPVLPVEESGVLELLAATR